MIRKSLEPSHTTQRNNQFPFGGMATRYLQEIEAQLG